MHILHYFLLTKRHLQTRTLFSRIWMPLLQFCSNLVPNHAIYAPRSLPTVCIGIGILVHVFFCNCICQCTVLLPVTLGSNFLLKCLNRIVHWPFPMVVKVIGYHSRASTIPVLSWIWDVFMSSENHQEKLWKAI